jgi:hypothetical protein
MDEHEKGDEQVEDLEMREEDAEGVKGGTHPITADDDWEQPMVAGPKGASPQLGKRG